jgi:hypothetical protein
LAPDLAARKIGMASDLQLAQIGLSPRTWSVKEAPVFPMPQRRVLEVAPTTRANFKVSLLGCNVMAQGDSHEEVAKAMTAILGKPSALRKAFAALVRTTAQHTELFDEVRFERPSKKWSTVRRCVCCSLCFVDRNSFSVWTSIRCWQYRAKVV